MSFNKLTVVAKPVKEHSCVWCPEKILIGEQHLRYVGKWEGEFQDWRTHVECEKAMKSSPSYEDGEICGGGHRRGAVCDC
jgi:hypothetical protein